jgi:hypothetical protein
LGTFFFFGFDGARFGWTIALSGDGARSRAGGPRFKGGADEKTSLSIKTQSIRSRGLSHGGNCEYAMNAYLKTINWEVAFITDVGISVMAFSCLYFCLL